MICHVVVVTWSDDADPTAEEAFVAQADAALSSAPFRAFVAGRDLKLGVLRSADWGYIAELDSIEDLEVWRDHAQVAAMVQSLAPLGATVVNMQLELPHGVSLAPS